MSVDFEYPVLVILSFIIIPLAAFFLLRMKNPFVEKIPLGAPGGIPFKASQIDGLVKFLKALEIIALFMLFFSAAGPSAKTAEIIYLNRGEDIIFAIDLSPSMAALDMDGENRFQAASSLLYEFALKRPSDNIGLVAFGDDAVLVIPPTADREALNLRLSELRIGEFGDGTALGMGLAVAAYHLDKSNARRKAVILITDGENNAGSIHPETAASMLREMGISLWVIGIGSMGEVPIDYVDPYTNIRRSGIFDSRFDAESLRRLSIAGGGNYIYAPTAQSLASVFSQLDDSEMTVRRSRVIHKRRNLSLYFLLPAMIILIIIRIVRRNLLRAVI